jgi:hypothetical protein
MASAEGSQRAQRTPQCTIQYDLGTNNSDPAKTQLQTYQQGMLIWHEHEKKWWRSGDTNNPRLVVLTNKELIIHSNTTRKKQSIKAVLMENVIVIELIPDMSVPNYPFTFGIRQKNNRIDTFSTDGISTLMRWIKVLKLKAAPATVIRLDISAYMREFKDITSRERQPNEDKLIAIEELEEHVSAQLKCCCGSTVALQQLQTQSENRPPNFEYENDAQRARNDSTEDIGFERLRSQQQTAQGKTTLPKMKMIYYPASQCSINSRGFASFGSEAQFNPLDQYHQADPSRTAALFDLLLTPAKQLPTRQSGSKATSVVNMEPFEDFWRLLKSSRTARE